MTLNDEIGALVLKNTRINPVNQTAYKNAFLLLSSTRALNELVTNTKPSDRARKQGIEDDAQYLKTPSGAKSSVKKPKTGKDAPKTDATPAQKPKPAPKKSAPAPAPKATIPTKESKAASKKLVASALKGGMEKVLSAKGVADKIIKRGRGRPTGATNAPGVTNRPRKAPTGDMGLSKKDVKGLFVREVARPARKQSDTDADMKSRVSIAKTAKMVKAKEKEVAALEKEAASLAKTAGSARRLGTKTQKKKK